MCRLQRHIHCGSTSKVAFRDCHISAGGVEGPASVCSVVISSPTAEHALREPECDPMRHHQLTHHCLAISRP